MLLTAAINYYLIKIIEIMTCGGAAVSAAVKPCVGRINMFDFLLIIMHVYLIGFLIVFICSVGLLGTYQSINVVCFIIGHHHQQQLQEQKHYPQVDASFFKVLI